MDRKTIDALKETKRGNPWVTPWEVSEVFTDEFDTEFAAIRQPGMSFESTICEVWGNNYDAKPVAEFIVVAVNTFDSLMAEIEKRDRDLDALRRVNAGMHIRMAASDADVIPKLQGMIAEMAHALEHVIDCTDCADCKRLCQSAVEHKHYEHYMED